MAPVFPIELTNGVTCNLITCLCVFILLLSLKSFKSKQRIVTFILSMAMIDCSYAFREDRTADNAYEIRNYEPVSFKGSIWSKTRYCNLGDYAIGFTLKVEKPGSSDATAANSFQLICAKYESSVETEIVKPRYEGSFGSFGANNMCSAGHHIKGFRTRVEGSLGTSWYDKAGTDDTALNSVEVKCSDGSIVEADNGRGWGDWGKPWTYCKSDYYVCGFRQEVMFGKSGYLAAHYAEDVGMTRLRLECCSAAISFNEIEGFWKPINVAGGTASITTSSVTSTSSTETVSSSFTKSLSVAVGGGFEVGISGGKASGSVQVTGSVARTVGRAISKTSGKSDGVSSTQSCPKKYFYQFMITADEMRSGKSVGVATYKSKHWVCSDTPFPQCVGGRCIDEDCQICYTYGYRDIKSILSGGYCITSSSTQIDINKCYNPDTQKWQLVPTSTRQPRKFIIKQKIELGDAGECLQIDHANFMDEVKYGKVELVACDKSKREQQFYYTDDGVIRSVNNKQCLSIEKKKARNGRKIQAATCDGKNYQKWKLVSFQNSQNIVGFNNNNNLMPVSGLLISALLVFVLICFGGFMCGAISGCLFGKIKEIYK